MIRRFRFASALSASFVVGTLAALPACSSHPAEGSPELGTSTHGIQGGTLDSSNEYTFNVGLCLGGRGNCRSVCSGTLITPNLVLTARHCVDDSPDKVDCSSGEVFGGQVIATNQMFVTTHNQMTGQSTQGWHSVKQVLRPPVNLPCGADIALLVLNDRATEAKIAIPAVQSAVWDRARYGSVMQAIGYGRTSFANNDAGTRRYRPNVPILCIPGSPNNNYREACPTGISENEFVGGDGVCPGDSGSGAMDQASLATATPIALGVVVRTGQDGSDCQDSLLTRTDVWRDFIIAGARTASANWSLYPEPSWTTFVAPPPLPPRPSGPTTPKPLGEACKLLVDCESRLCKNRPDDGSLVCSQACSPSKECPAGYECVDKLCFTPTPPEPQPTPAPAAPAPAQPPAAEAPATVTTTTSGCSAAPDPTKPVPWRAVAGLAAALGLTLLRRRRRP
ncbi:MAG: trypsin-like serine protease [Myxococcales bacterium]|nr:trypsin-like serine protease [Myxococcales bacterium]MBL0195788.1 trypsin-like serine protease [Myxococcales bacterium]HQY60424.1 trypsin-like serine protease [Polyangiaceae bacterium]